MHQKQFLETNHRRMFEHLEMEFEQVMLEITSV